MKRFKNLLKSFKPYGHKGPGKRGHIVGDTLLPTMFLGLPELGNICCGHKIFLNKIRHIVCVPDTKFVSATNVAPADKRGNICVGNNASSFFRAFKGNKTVTKPVRLKNWFKLPHISQES